VIRTDTGPFSITPHWLLMSEVSDRALRLYALLGRYADNKTGQAHPGRVRLATEMRCSESSLDRATKELVAAGALLVSQRLTEHGDFATNLYTVLRVPSPVTPPVPSELVVGGVSDDERTRTIELDPETSSASSPVTTHDPVWEAFVEVFGAPTNKNAHGRRNKAVQLVKESLAHLGITAPEYVFTEVRGRARMWPRLFEGATLTDTALANNWDRLTAPRRIVTTANPPEEELEVLPLEESAERIRELLDGMNQIGRDT
jgi:hypothetical protein